jgi:hypothetical protein
MFESVGEVVGWVSDLGSASEIERRRQRTKVSDDDALGVITIPTPVPRAILWEWATSPARRVQWGTGMTDVVEDLAGGRRGVGTVNHCMHAKSVSVDLPARSEGAPGGCRLRGLVCRGASGASDCPRAAMRTRQ